MQTDSQSTWVSAKDACQFPAPAPKKRSHNLWVKAASFILVVFTIFVLLDTFAIARVQQVVQPANAASITSVNTGASTSSSNATASPASAASQTTEATSAAETTQVAAGVVASSHGSTLQVNTADATQATNANTAATTESAGAAGDNTGSATQATSTDTTDNIKIEVSTLRAYDTDVYIADVQVSSAEYLKTAFAQNAFGRNIKETTSDIAANNNAQLAINSDYYGFRDDGYVIRNGVLYRDTAAANTDALVVYGDGTLSAVSQDEVSAQELLDSGAWQVLSFGPVLVQDGQIMVSEGEEVGQAMHSNPRTAIGMIDPLHYIVVVSDGRTDSSEGLSLYQLAEVMQQAGATFAYNLDGGGSTTMYYNGEVINNPTGGRGSGERAVSDIVYFG